MRGRGTASIVASPVLVGAVTVLIVIVGVFLAYNANNGLPFVPTYDLKAELPSGQKLVRGNEIRLGGFLVGTVSELKPGNVTVNGKTRAIAIVTMKLQKTVQPLPKDSVVGVRPRSALGLKYIDIVPGKSKAGFRVGDTIPLKQAKLQGVEYEDVFSTFDKPTRDNSRTALKGFGDAFAGRGSSINEAIAAFNPFFTHLTPVMQTLSNPNTHLENFFKNIGHASAEVAPVAKVQAALFGKMAKTFDAISACAKCLQDTIQKSPPTMAVMSDSMHVQRPFLAEFTSLSKELRPTVATLHGHLGTINAALETGTPVLKRTVPMNKLTGDVFQALDDLAKNPTTLLALQDLHTTFAVLRPLAEFVAPYNTVCNNANSFFTGLATHMSESVTGGTSEVVLVRSGTNQQEHSFGQTESERPADVPSNKDPQTYVDPAGDHYQTLHGEAYSPAVDAQGNADCQGGQYGYLDGPYSLNSKYPPADIGANESFKSWENRAGGGSHTTSRMDHPGLAGPTFSGTRLGITSLKDVK
ncbi:MAG: phospholipid/cholesterol/gamma-HCH transport system substrate-binding protein [Thermoleophilaceae bacterium]|nr:phospholipid/cholesterol/gamma-HCH transport system substrate-binding protein [Thermoleophilaceae bacterium]